MGSSIRTSDLYERHMSSFVGETPSMQPLFMYFATQDRKALDRCSPFLYDAEAHRPRPGSFNMIAACPLRTCIHLDCAQPQMNVPWLFVIW